MTDRAKTKTGGRHVRPLCASEPVKAWDPLVRITHWGVAGAVLACAFGLDPEGQSHQIIGYLGVGLVLLRLAWGVVGTPTARFTAFPPSPSAALRHLTDLHRGRRHVHISHNPAGALMVYNLWATVLFMGMTGAMMGWTAMPNGLAEGLHELGFAWLMACVLLHLGGVILESRLTGARLVAAMVHGRKTRPRGGA